MNDQDYLAMVRQLESNFFHVNFTGGVPGKTAEINFKRLAHSIMGLCDEAGELMKILKAAMFYGQVINLNKVIAEYGDSEWYHTLGLDAIGCSKADCRLLNARKLGIKRYNDAGHFCADAAINRDTDEEDKVFDEDRKAIIWTPNSY
jgi:hypothetical protein